MSPIQVYVGVSFGDSKSLCSISTALSSRSHRFVQCYNLLTTCLFFQPNSGLGLFLLIQFGFGFIHITEANVLHSTLVCWTSSFGFSGVEVVFRNFKCKVFVSSEFIRDPLLPT
jgi:hypothetical protein